MDIPDTFKFRHQGGSVTIHTATKQEDGTWKVEWVNHNGKEAFGTHTAEEIERGFEHGNWEMIQ